MTLRTRLLLLLFCSSLMVKLGVVAYMNASPAFAWNLISSDTREAYIPIAMSLLHGNGYNVEGARPRKVEGIAPVFPVYLALTYRVFGADAPTWWQGALNALFRAATTLLVYALAVRAFGNPAALFAGLLHAFDVWDAFWAAFVLKESLGVPASILALWLVVRALEQPTVLRAAGAGAALAAAGLTRYASFGLAGVAIAALATLLARKAVPAKAAWTASAAAAVAFGAVAAVWFVPTSARFGAPIAYVRPAFHLFVSNGPGAERKPDTSGYSGESTGSLAVARRVAPLQDSSSAREMPLLRATVAHMLTHPLTTLTLVAARFVNMWRPTFAGSSAANIIVLGLPYSIVFVLGIAGLVMGMRRLGDAGPSLLTLYYGVAYYVALHAVFWAEIRYRQYVMPLLIVFAGFALAVIAERLAAARTR